MKPKSAELTVRRLALSKLKAHPRNPRKHPEPGSPEWETLRKSIEHDYFDPIVWNKRNGMLVSGHLRTKILAASGYSSADCVIVDYDEPTHLARMIAANKATGENNESLLKEIFIDLDKQEIDLDLTGFTGGELDALEIFQPDEIPSDDDHAVGLIDKASELQKVWKTKRGQVWELGNHRLMCGDSRDCVEINKLCAGRSAHACITDLPYNIGKDYGVWDDSLTEKKFWVEVIPAWINGVKSCISDKGHFTTSFSQVGIFKLVEAATSCGFEFRHIGVWHNPSRCAGSYPGQWPFSWEPIIDFTIGGFGKLQNGNSVGSKDVWVLNSPIKSRSDRKKVYHPCEKPLALFVDLVALLTPKQGLVYEPFSGSGTTLIACEQLNRRCRAMEICPAYVAVALQRWADLTGKTPKAIHA